MYFDYFTKRSQVLKISFTTKTFTQEVTLLKNESYVQHLTKQHGRKGADIFVNFPFCVPALSTSLIFTQ